MSESLAAAVRSFEMEPARYAQPERLQSHLPVGLTMDVCQRLVACERLHDRLSVVVRQALGPETCGIEEFQPVERRLALLDAPGLVRAARLAGAVWHANQFRRVIRSKAVNELVGRIGDDAYRFAMSNVDLSVKNLPAQEATDLAAAIDHDGRLCLSAWRARLPRAIAARVLLKLPPAIDIEAEPTRLHWEHGPPIMGRVAAMLSTYD